MLIDFFYKRIVILFSSLKTIFLRVFNEIKDYFIEPELIVEFKWK